MTIIPAMWMLPEIAADCRNVTDLRSSDMGHSLVESWIHLLTKRIASSIARGTSVPICQEPSSVFVIVFKP